MKTVIDDSECGHVARRHVVVVIETKKYRKAITVTPDWVTVGIAGDKHSASITIHYKDLLKEGK